MSLQYIIDAYNLINHRRFKAPKPTANIQQALVDFIRINRITGSKNNKVILVFDGYPPANQDMPEGEGLVCMFSRKIEADELIRKIVEKSASAANIIVVSDDKQVQLTSRLLHARICGVEEFICCRKSNKLISFESLNPAEAKLTYTAMRKINEELKKLWLS